MVPTPVLFFSFLVIAFLVMLAIQSQQLLPELVRRPPQPQQQILPQCLSVRLPFLSTQWNSPTTLNSGQLASLTVTTSLDCTGQPVSIQITEDTLPNTIYLAGAMFGTSLTANWAVQFVPDNDNTPNMNEWKFTASLISNPSANITSSNTLYVQTPQFCGNGICDPNEFNATCPADCTIRSIGAVNLRHGHFPRVVVKEGWAFLAKGESTRGFAVMNISRPLKDITIDAEIHLDGAGFQNNLDVYGDFAYVVDFHTGLYIVNISDPLNPSLVSQWYTPDANSIKIVPYHGDSLLLAYIGKKGDKGQVANVTDPFNVNMSFGAFSYTPESSFNLAPFALLASLDQMNNITYAAFSMHIDGDKLFLANAYTGLEIYNISDPSTGSSGNYIPQHLGYYDANTSVLDVFAAGNYVYLSTAERGLLKVNIANPGSPVLAEQYLDKMFFTRGVFADENYVYLTGSEITTTYNLSALWNNLSLLNPTLYNALQQINQSSPSLSQVAEHYLLNYFVKKSRDNPGNLLTAKNAFKVLNPTTLTVVKENIHSPQTPNYYLANPNQVFSYPVIKAGIAFFPDRAPAGIRILNISDSPLSLRNTVRILGEIVDSTVLGDILFVNYAGSVNITDPINPQVLTYFEPNTAFGGHKVVRGRGNALYISGVKETKIFDVADPKKPKEIGLLELNASDPLVTYSPRNFDLDGEYLYAVFTRPFALPGPGPLNNPGSLHLGIYNISDPLNPQAISGSIIDLNIPGSMNKPGGPVYASGDLVFLLQGNALYVINVTNKSLPFVSGVLTSTSIIGGQGQANPMIRAENWLFIGNGKHLYEFLPFPENYITAVNISNSSNPTKVSGLTDLIIVSDFHPFSDNLLIAIEQRRGPFILDFSNITNLKIKAVHELITQEQENSGDVYDAGYLRNVGSLTVFGNIKFDKIRISNLTNIVPY